MKVKQLHLQNFKKFTEKTIDFSDSETGLAKDLIVLVGPNGSGKTSVLQAIAATLGTACGRIKSPDLLVWPGFEHQLCGYNHQKEALVELSVQFSEEEIEATADYYDHLRKGNDALLVAPSKKNRIQLTYCDGRVEAPTSKEWFQFRGREYAKQRVRAKGYEVFHSVGSVFWYTDHRSALSFTAEDGSTGTVFSFDQLRDRLSKWKMGQVLAERRGELGRNLIGRLESMYQKVFPNRSFYGPVERGTIDDVMEEPWFHLFDGRFYYDVMEMSGAERALFPILFDFANWDINHSVVLIDEIELHLHPPIQQAFLRALRQLGQHNQIILTTHSDFIYDIVPESSILRLES